MPFFMKRVHEHGTLGEDLQELRERAGLSREEMSLRTKLTPATIQALETSQWHTLGIEKAYLEKMLVAYVRSFEAPDAFFRKKFHDEQEAYAQHASPAALQALKPFSWFDAFMFHRVKMIGATVFFVSVLGCYMVAQARGMGDAPLLEISTPKNGEQLTRPTVRIEGKTEQETRVFINEQPASLREDGTFFLEMDLPRGTTDLRIRAKKRYSREAMADVHVVYERAEQKTEDL